MTDLQTVGDTRRTILAQVVFCGARGSDFCGAPCTVNIALSMVVRPSGIPVPVCTTRAFAVLCGPS